MFNKDQLAYKQFRDIYSQSTQQIIFWIGAGLSTPAGIPSWEKLRKRLDDEAQQKVQSLPRLEREARLKEISGIRGIAHMWVAIGKLKEILGEATFPSIINDAVAVKSGVPVPVAYLKMWNLHISGVMNLNLDRLATRAFQEVHGGSLIDEFDGLSIGNYLHVLRKQKPFIANLHGIVSNQSSWVLTLSELEVLRSSEAYNNFINATLSAKTVLFLGISADDIATGGFLEKLRKQGSNPGSHYWLTDRTDLTTDRWAESAGIQIINYNSPGGDHSAVNEFLDDLATYLPQDSVPLPVLQTVSTPLPPLPTPDELRKREPEEIRQILNAHASAILSNPNTELALAEYEKFLHAYDLAIHIAWYASNEPAGNKFFGYSLIEELGAGAFGKVYRAADSEGKSLAIKILRHDVHGNSGMLRSFRRGVKSMKILSQRSVLGMVPYQAAYELPACAIMDLVEGPNLQEAVESRYIQNPTQRLKIAVELVRIIRRGHLLPEHVLHRDIRPANVMLKGYFSDPDEFQVVVLDFDLSWHKDALEKSIDLKGSAALGYVAPEQLEDVPGVSTRNALVDSFGLGMTIYYLFAEKHPLVGDYKREDWPLTITRNIDVDSALWKSLGPRISRLIARSTRFKQRDRMDASNIEAELERLHNANLSPFSVKSAELWAEELLARAFGTLEYTWDEDTLKGNWTGRASGLSILLEGDESRNCLKLSIGWASGGGHDHKTLSKFIPTALKQTRSLLSSNGWSVDVEEFTAATINFTATCHLPDSENAIHRLVKSLQGTKDLIRFS